MSDLHAIFSEVDAIVARGEPHQALSVLEDVRSKFPDNEVAQIKTANILAYIGKLDDAENLLTSLLGRGCENNWLYVSLFDVLFLAKKFKQASLLIASIGNKFPDFWPIRERTSRSEAYLLLNKDVNADDYCSEFKKSVLVIGSSHINSIHHASQLSEQNTLHNKYTFKSLMEFRSDSRIIDPISGGFDNYKLNGELQKWLSENSGFNRVFLSISGSDYLSFCISQPIPSYDVIIPSQEKLPRIENSRIIPYEEIKAKLRKHIRHVLLGIKAIREEMSAPIFYLEPPPPIEDNEHIVQHAGWAERLLAKAGPSSPILRYKLWLIHSEIIKEACELAGVTFLHLPSRVMNERGFLADRMLLNDVMHANTLFGAEIFLQMEALA